MQKYLIKVEGMAPVKLSYEVMAEDEDRAYEMLEKTPHLLTLREKPQIDLKRMRKNSFSIIEVLTGLVKMFRRF